MLPAASWRHTLLCWALLVLSLSGAPPSCQWLPAGVDAAAPQSPALSGWRLLRDHFRRGLHASSSSGKASDLPSFAACEDIPDECKQHAHALKHHQEVAQVRLLVQPALS